MKQKNLYLMCGVPGSGKTTWAKNILAKGGEIIHYHSRDEVRFEMVPETEEYFSKEKQVFKEWVRRGQASLQSEGVDAVIMDATHIDVKSRAKTLNALNLGEDYVVNFVVMVTSVERSLENNKKRQGREQVPVDVVMRMQSMFKLPDCQERVKWNATVLTIKEG